MARLRRPHIPGVPFHLTARLQGRAPLFVGMESTVAHAIRQEASRTDGELLAYAVMPNHLHIVFVQGARPLAHFMQPLLRRLALGVHARNKSEGHVFQRRYHSSPCNDPEYLRNAIAYVHLNAVRARLCKQPDQYSWTTHGDYVSGSVDCFSERAGTLSGLRLFAAETGSAHERVIGNYRAFLEWRLAMDACHEDSSNGTVSSPGERPVTAAGDEYWVDRYGWSCTARAENELPRRPALDLRDLALRILRESAPGMPLELLRSGQRTRPLVAVRRQFITRAKECGHRNRSVARFLHISDVTVSRT